MDKPADPGRKAPPPARTPAQQREDRLAAALKANIARRKEQAGARARGPDDDGNDNNDMA
jgi:hypothetical protein